MFNLAAVKHKNILRKALSNCFEPLKDELGNVPISMQKDKHIAAYILGICRTYAEIQGLNETTFNLMVDAAFDELFRRESVEVQTRAETWLQTNDDTFMEAYYFAKQHTIENALNLNWLSVHAQKHFKAGHQVMFAL